MSDSQMKRVGVYGLGYVGCVSAACLASRGCRVVGVDVNPDKVESVRQGRSPVVEEKIGELTAEVVTAGMLTVTTDAYATVLGTDISLICVGTPSTTGGGLSTRFLEQVTTEIGAALADKDQWHTVVYRSTMLPGTCETLLIPLLEKASGKRAGRDFGVCVNPEFLREGSSVRDFLNPPKTVVGETDPRSGEAVIGLYEGLPGPRFRVPVRVAEMTKYVDNSFHALKVCFANEIGAICSSLAAGLARRHGHLPCRHQVEHQPCLSSAGIRLRRLMPPQGRPRSHPYRAPQRPRCPLAGECAHLQ